LEKDGTPDEFYIMCPICKTSTFIDEETVQSIILMVEGEEGMEGEEYEGEEELD